MKHLLAAAIFLALATMAWSQQRDALQAYRDGHYDDAVAITQDELKSSPNNLDSYVVMGWSLEKLERYQDALSVAQQGLKISPYDYRLMEILGEASFYLAKPAQALKAFEQYVVLAPSGDRIEKVYYFMGEIFLQMGQYNRADIALTTAVYHSPQTPSWWARLGYARMLAKEYPEAQQAYKEALRQNPGLNEAIRGEQQVETLLKAATAQ